MCDKRKFNAVAVVVVSEDRKKKKCGNFGIVKTTTTKTTTTMMMRSRKEHRERKAKLNFYYVCTLKVYHHQILRNGERESERCLSMSWNSMPSSVSSAIAIAIVQWHEMKFLFMFPFFLPPHLLCFFCVSARLSLSILFFLLCSYSSCLYGAP